jgi:hypothetical protein
MKTPGETPPCKQCGSPVAVREITTTDIRYHPSRRHGRRVCTNPGCRTRELMLLTP